MSVPVPRCFAPPRTLGGDADLRLVKLEKKHLTQADTSLNGKIWALWILEESKMDQSNMTLRHYHDWVAGPPFDFNKDLKQSTIQLEKLWLTTKIMTLLSCDVANVAHAHIRRKIQDKAAGRIEPVDVVVKRIKATKEEANALYRLGTQPGYSRAQIGYMECIIDLIPWFASPVFLTAEQAHDTGLAELDAQIWNNFFLASFKMLPAEREMTQDTILCGAAIDAVLQGRYAPARLLYKARHNYIKFFETQGRPEIQAEMPYLKALLDEMKDKTSADWAHRDCISEHVCFTDAGRALVRKLESPEEKAKHLPGIGPKPTPKHYTWDKVGKHVWGSGAPTL